MFNILSRLGALGVVMTAFTVSAMGQSRRVFVPRDTIVPVVVENDLTLRRAREGDRFTAHVDDDRDLPRNTRLIGRVRRVEQENRDRRAFVDLEFTDVILPDGSRHAIDAIPVSLDSRYVNRRDDGRIVVKEDTRKKEGYVLGGTVGGFILGSIIHKQAESTVLGTLAGVILAEADKSNDGNTILRRNQRVGALIQRDLALDSYDRVGRGRRDGRYDDRDDDRYDGRYDDQDRNRDRNQNRDRDRDRNNGRGWDDRSDRRDRDQDTVLSRRGDRDIALTYDGRSLDFRGSAMPYYEGDTVMVPLESTCNQLGVSYEPGRSKAIYLENEDSSLRLEQGSQEARLNGRRVQLTTSVVEKDGVLYAPIDILAAITKSSILVNGKRVNPRES